MNRAALCVAISALLAACGGDTPSSPLPAPAPAAPAAPAAPSAPIEANWPTYHGATSLDGVADLALPEALAQRWQFDAGAAVLNTPVAMGQHIFFANTKGKIFALTLDGAEIWSRTFEKPATPPRAILFDAPLAVLGGKLIACGADGEIFALDPATGSTIWQAATEIPVLGSPNFNGKDLFIIDQAAGGLAALDINSGKVLWNTPGRDRCDASPAVGREVAVFGSCASAIHIFSTADGKLAREIPLDQESQIAGGVVLLGDSVFTASRSGRFLHANAKTGEIIWSNADCEGEAFSTPAVDAETVIFGANDSVLYALHRKDGTLKWKQKLGDTPLSAVIARDKLLVAAGGTLYLLRTDTGATLWSFPVSDEITSPAVAGSLVIVGSGDGTVTAFGAKPTEP